MRKAVLLLAMVLAFNLSNAQDEYRTFTTEGTTITAAVTKKGVVYLDLDNDSKYGLIFDKEADRRRFTSFISESWKTHLKWKKTAKENNVFDIIKDIKTFEIKGYFKLGGWNFGQANIKTGFQVTKTGKINFFIYGSKIKSGSNEYIKSDTAIMLFKTQGKIDEFLNILSTPTIEAFLTKEKSKDKLFN